METKVLSSGTRYTSLPENYVRPESDRPRLSEVAVCNNVPVIDLGCGERELIVKQIAQACSEYGFFQVINHGVPKKAIEDMLKVAQEFFQLPVEEKMKLYSDDPSKTMRLSTSFNVKKETVHNWRDYLRLHCHPLEKYSPEWPSNPSSFRKNVGASIYRAIVSNYVKEVRELGFRVEEAISESLGLEKGSIREVLGEQGQHMAVNFYPPCPEPELTYGLPAHTDPNALTILLQDTQVSGLQVLKDGKWLAVKPHPDAFALSNGKYKSVWHRAVVNSDRERMSVASFLCPSDDAVISAPKQLSDDGSPAVYRNFTYDEYYKKFWSRNLDQEHCLELFKN
nr:protein DOWNY MILDEW RESISTANCE 6 [Ipomoea batatas]